MPRVIRALSRPYKSRDGVPVVDRVDLAIFRARYFVQCMECSYCFDSCCAYGTDVDAPTVERLRAEGKALEDFTGVTRDRWFTETWEHDPDTPGGRSTRTAVEDGACVFRNKSGRGCLIHSYALSKKRDYHDLKPMVAVLFPVTWDEGLLHPSNEIEDRSLQCIDDGPTVYRGVRSEIEWYFGPELVRELDELERGALAGTPPAK